MKRKTKTRKLLVILLFSILLSVCVKPAEADEPLNAAKFVLNGNYSIDTWLTESEEEHWYRVDIPSDGLLELRIMSYCSGSLYYSLWNDDLSQRYKFTSCSDYISGGSTTSPVTGTVTKVLTKGTYYFCLSGTTGRYRIMGKHTSYGVNDAGAYSYDSPLDYGMGSQITGALTETDTEDWYRIKVSQSGEYSLKLMSYCGERIYYKLFNADLSTKYMDSSVESASAVAPSSKEEKAVLGAGTYYLKISDARGKYIMSFKNAQASQKKKLKLTVTAKKGKKKIVVKTNAKASVTVTYGGRKWNKNSGKSGKVTISVGKKLKKGKKVKVTVKKSGYNTKKKTVKIK